MGDEEEVVVATGLPLPTASKAEDLWEERLRSEAELGAEVQKPPEIYQPLPRQFVYRGGKVCGWPETTNLCCWSCHHTFDSAPRFMPTHQRECDGTIEMGVHGVFCSFPCAGRYIADRVPRNMQQHRERLLQTEYELFTGQSCRMIVLAPRVTVTRRYGGDMDGEAYRAEIRRLEAQMVRPRSDSGPQVCGRTAWDQTGDEDDVLTELGL